MYPPKLMHHLVDGGLEGLEVGGVQVEGGNIRAVGLQVSDGAGQVGVIDVGGEDMGAGAAQGAGDPRAEP
jgi:hypothetical protein